MDEEVWNHAVFSKNRERLLLQLLALHSRQHFHSPQLTAAHRCSPQCGLLPRPLIRGHFNRGEKGTLSSRYNTGNTSLAGHWLKKCAFESDARRWVSSILSPRGPAVQVPSHLAPVRAWGAHP